MDPMASGPIEGQAMRTEFGVPDRSCSTHNKHRAEVAAHSEADLRFSMAVHSHPSGGRSTAC